MQNSEKYDEVLRGEELITKNENAYNTGTIVYINDLVPRFQLLRKETI